MRCVFYVNHTDRERELAQCVKLGAETYGDSIDIVPVWQFAEPDESYDVAIAFGVKRGSSDIIKAYRSCHVHTLFLDKAHLPKDRAKYTRVAIDGMMPNLADRTKWRGNDRFRALGLELKYPVTPSTNAIIVGSSQKYCDAWDIGDTEEYNAKLIKLALKNGFQPNLSTKYTKNLGELLKSAGVLVTHGSNACIDALLAGVPSIIFGEHPIKTIMPCDLYYIRQGWKIDRDVAFAFLSELAYWQWTQDEYASGEAWGHIRERILA